MIIRTGKFSENFKTQGKLVSSPNGFRPINNLNAVDKIVESVLKTQLKAYLVREEIIPKEHPGCRPGYSTGTAVQSMEETI